MSIRQISVFLENKPGKLSEMTALLAANNIDIRALSLAETNDFGIARMIVDDAYEALNMLRNNDFIANISHVLAFAVPNVPGGLNKLLNVFNEANVNIIYMYSCLGSNDPSRAYMLFRVSDTNASEAALAAHGLRSLTQEQITEI